MYYSFLSASTGFLAAALKLTQMVVRIAIRYIRRPERTNIHQLISVRYAKVCAHCQMIYQAMGPPRQKATIIHFEKSIIIDDPPSPEGEGGSSK